MGNGAGRDGPDGTLSAMEYLTSILASKVYDVAYESPLQLASKLSERWGVNVWLKREDLQPVRGWCACVFLSVSVFLYVSKFLHALYDCVKISQEIDRILKRES